MGQILIGSKNLELSMQIPNTQSVLEFVNQFGSLSVGKIQPRVFKSAFEELKHRVLLWLVDLDKIQDDDDTRIGHKLDLCHQALQSGWRLPGTASVANGDFFWESGLSRILAGGLAWPNAWQQHRLLLLAPNFGYADQYLVDPVEITREEDLIQAFGGPGHRLSTRISVDDQFRASFRLGAVQTQMPYIRNYLMDLDIRVDNLREWIRLYPPGSTLNVYTDRPDLITDSVGFWNICHAGPGIRLDDPRKIDYELYKLSTSRPTGPHEFYVQNRTGTIDVAELLFWQHLKYTGFATQDWQCVLRRPDPVFYAKEIGLSQWK